MHTCHRSITPTTRAHTHVLLLYTRARAFSCSKPPPTVTYELPDGNTVKIRNSQQLIPELHFRPDLTDNVRHLLAHRQTPAWIMQYQSQSITMRHSVQLANGSTVSVPVPLPTMIHNALLNCTPEVRREMCNHGASL